jgi:hypothetical protein
MGAKAAVVEPDVADPSVDDAGILTRRNVRLPMRPATKKVTVPIRWLASQQAFDRLPCHLRDFELHRPTGLLLHNDPTIANKSARADVLCSETDQI